MIYGYARCSTTEKKQDVSRQVTELKEMGAEKVYTEYVSGVNPKRPQYELLLKALQPGDTICALEVSRLTRSTQQLCDLIALAKAKGLKIDIKNGLKLDCTADKLDVMTEAMILISGVFAQMERELTRERIKSGLEAARRKGKQIGRKPVTTADIPKKVKNYRKKFLAGELSQAECCRLCNISKNTFKKYNRMLTEEEQAQAKEG